MEQNVARFQKPKWQAARVSHKASLRFPKKLYSPDLQALIFRAGPVVTHDLFPRFPLAAFQLAHLIGEPHAIGPVSPEDRPHEKKAHLAVAEVLPQDRLYAANPRSVDVGARALPAVFGVYRYVGVPPLSHCSDDSAYSLSTACENRRLRSSGDTLCRQIPNRPLEKEYPNQAFPTRPRLFSPFR